MKNSILLLGLLTTGASASGIDVIQTGEYKVGDCDASVYAPNKESPRYLFSIASNTGRIYVDYDPETNEGDCIFFMANRMQAVILQTKTDSSATLQFACGNEWASYEGSVELMVDSSGKVTGAKQKLNYARYAIPGFSVPFLKDEATPISCGDL